MRAVIFDMDGVLIDSEAHHQEIEYRIFEELKIKITEKEREPFIGMASDELWEAVVKRYGLSKSPRDLLNLNNRRILEYFQKLNDLKPIPGVLPVLEWVRKQPLPMAVASSSSRMVIDFLLEQTGIDEYFDLRVGGQSVERSKPEPYIYLHTARLLGVPPERCLTVEDSSNGIAAAKGAGMYCVGYQGTGFHGQDQSQADLVINHFDDLIPILESVFG